MGRAGGTRQASGSRPSSAPPCLPWPAAVPWAVCTAVGSRCCRCRPLVLGRDTAVLSSRLVGVFLLFDTGGRAGVSQARSNLHSGAGAGGDVPLQSLLRVTVLVPAWSGVWVINSRGPVCVGPPTPPVPLLRDPHCHCANMQGSGSCPVQACALPAMHAAVPWHSRPGPLPCWMVQSPGAGRESAHKQGEPSQALAVLQGVAGSRDALSSWPWFLSFGGDFAGLILAAGTSEQAEPPHSSTSGAGWLCSLFIAAETHT